jgi:hypothetical protein
VTLPDGWQFEDAAPQVTAVGAPGSLTTQLSLPGGFQPVANTVSPYFVDHSDGKYVYEVVARTAAGARSAPSNVQVVPFGGSAATFTSLQSTLGASLSTAVQPALATAGAVQRTTTSHLQSLLSAAETAASHHQDALAIRELGELQAQAGDNDALAAVAARVARRLQYANVAGAP